MNSGGRITSDPQTGVTLSAVVLQDIGEYICRAIKGDIEEEKKFLIYPVRGTSCDQGLKFLLVNVIACWEAEAKRIQIVERVELRMTTYQIQDFQSEFTVEIFFEVEKFRQKEQPLKNLSKRLTLNFQFYVDS